MRRFRDPGFTLIELLVALAVIALLLSIVTPRYFGSVSRTQETVLRENLHLMRDALDKFYSDAGRYPDALDELVAKRYLRSIPDDPITGSSATWVVLAPKDAKGLEGKGVFDVKSGAQGTGRDGTPYEKW